MKTLLILRHGKAEASAPKGDKDRALTKRGRSDAETMGRRIAALAGRLDAVVASNARRARQTAQIAAAAAGFTAPITLEPDIYEADAATLLGVVRGLPKNADCVLLVGHNPGFEQLAAQLAGEHASSAPLPTAGLVHLQIEAARWSDVGPGGARFEGRHTPDD